MSDNPAPQRPPGPRMSHLQSEPVPISFASPQQLAQFTAGAGSFFSGPRMKTPYQSFMPQMNTTFNNMNNTSYQTQPVPLIQNNTTVAAASASAATSHSSASGQKALTPLPEQPIDLSTFKGFKFVTLDPLQLETREVYDAISGTFQWEMFENQDDRCIGSIRDDLKNKRVFLISSGSLGAKIVPQIHDLPQIYAIYVYCANVKYHQEWAQKYPKIRVVCDNDDLYLLPQFAVDVAQSNIDWGNALLKQGTRDKAKEKFKLAFDKLNNYARNHDPVMDAEIKKKLDECK